MDDPGVAGVPDPYPAEAAGQSSSIHFGGSGENKTRKVFCSLIIIAQLHTNYNISTTFTEIVSGCCLQLLLAAKFKLWFTGVKESFRSLSLALQMLVLKM